MRFHDYTKSRGFNGAERVKRILNDLECKYWGLKIDSIVHEPMEYGGNFLIFFSFEDLRCNREEQNDEEEE